MLFFKLGTWTSSNKRMNNSIRLSKEFFEWFFLLKVTQWLSGILSFNLLLAGCAVLCNLCVNVFESNFDWVILSLVVTWLPQFSGEFLSQYFSDFYLSKLFSLHKVFSNLYIFSKYFFSCAASCFRLMGLSDGNHL